SPVLLPPTSCLLPLRRPPSSTLFPYTTLFRSVSEEAVAEQERIMGLDRPFLVQYGIWLGNAVRGDLGTSFTSRTPVTEELAKHMAPTAGMTVMVVTVTGWVSVPLGNLCAVYKDRLLERVMRACSYVGISLPSSLT